MKASTLFEKELLQVYETNINFELFQKKII